MYPARITRMFCLLVVTLAYAFPPQAHAARLSMRFAGGGNEVTLGFGETATIEVLWTMQGTDTAKSGARVTGINLRFNVNDPFGGPADPNLVVESAAALPGWNFTGQLSVPFTESDFICGLDDPSGAGVMANGTTFGTVLGSFVIRNDALDAVADSFVTMRHADYADPLPHAQLGAGSWVFAWQWEPYASKQFDMGQGNPGDAGDAWSPYHGYETFAPLVVHMVGWETGPDGPDSVDPAGGMDSGESSPPELYPCVYKRFTTQADFDAGLNVNVTGGPARLVREYPEALPYVWVACTARGTIVRIDAASGDILGEYLSAPDGRGPSRVTTDLFGNTWVGNSAEFGGGQGSVVKIGWLAGGTRSGSYVEPPFDFCSCVDRDGDGRIHTSLGLGDILSWPDRGDGLGGGGCDAPVSDAADECILIYQRVRSKEVLHVSVDGDNNVWVGGLETPAPFGDNHPFELLDGQTGRSVTSFEPVIGLIAFGGFGGLVDGNGVLWSSELGEKLLRYDSASNLWQHIDSGGASFGLGIDTSGSIWVSQWTAGTVIKLYPDGQPFPGFPKSLLGLPSYDGPEPIYDEGIAVTPTDNDVWIANKGTNTLTRLHNNGNYVATIDLDIDGEGPTAVSVDATGKVWTTCYKTLSGGNAKRIDPSSNLVDLTVELGAGAFPNDLGDLTGTAALLAQKFGLWNLIHDSGAAGVLWKLVTWNDDPLEACSQGTGSSIRVQVRAADDRAALTREQFVEVVNGEPLLPAVAGRFVEVRAILHGRSTPGQFTTPWLCNLTLSGADNRTRNCVPGGSLNPCEFDDCNLNCTPDSEDIAVGLSADIDHDGVPDECLASTDFAIWYVDATADGDNDGTSWENAFTVLQSALAAASASGCGTREIWVAAGTYKPTGAYGEQTATFTLRNRVAIYGGFSGNETTLAQRDPKVHITALSGDLDSNDPVEECPEYSASYDNSYHVVTAIGTDPSAVLDGFIITGGAAHGYASDGTTVGGGLYVSEGAPTVRNCTFAYNFANDWGGGVHLEDSSFPMLVNCSFIGNCSGELGGALLVEYASAATVVNGIFKNNTSQYGGAIQVWHAELNAVNCTFSGNIAYAKGGAIEVSYFPYTDDDAHPFIPPGSSATLTNCILWGNEAASAADGPQIANAYEGNASYPNSIIAVSHCDVQGGQAEVNLISGGTLIWCDSNLDVDPAFADAEFRLSATSPCIDAGVNYALPSGVLTDYDGYPRIADGNADRATVVDMGAYELGADCNANGHPDDADIASGTSQDGDGDGVPDECQVALAYMRSYKTHGTRGNFYIEMGMDPCNPVACEPRPGGVTWIEVGFTRPIDSASFSGAGGYGPGWLWLCNDANAVYVPAEATLDATGTKATFKNFLLNGQAPPDDERYEFTASPELRGLNGQSLAGDRNGEILVYAKDVNCDGERDQADRDAVCALCCQGLPCSDPSCTSPYPSLYVNQLNARFDLVMSPPLYAGLIGGQEITAVGSGTATYTLNRSDGACCDFEADIDTDSNNDGVIDESDDAIEDDPELPGRVFAVNSDDDNDNGIQDLDEAGVAGEDNLVEIHLSTTCPPIDPDSLTWSLSWPNVAPPLLQIWENPNKTSCNFGGPIENGVEYPWPPPATLWMEALETIHDRLSFSVFGSETRSTSVDFAFFMIPNCHPSPPIPGQHPAAGRSYVRATKVDQDVRGCAAYITTHLVHLCAESLYPIDGQSGAYVGVTQGALIPNVRSWVATGYRKILDPPAYSQVTWQRYSEAVVYSPPSLWVDIFDGPAPEEGIHHYRINISGGSYISSFDEIPEWGDYDNNMSSFVGQKALYFTEILNLEDQMVGTVQNPCYFSDCEYYTPSRGWDWANLAPSDLSSTNPSQWMHEWDSGTQFRAWDVYPNQ